MKLYLKLKNIWKKYNWIFIYKKSLHTLGRLDYFLGNLLIASTILLTIMVAALIPTPLMIPLLIISAIGTSLNTFYLTARRLRDLKMNVSFWMGYILISNAFLDIIDRVYSSELTEVDVILFSPLERIFYNLIFLLMALLGLSLVYIGIKLLFFKSPVDS